VVLSVPAPAHVDEMKHLSIVASSARPAIEVHTALPASHLLLIVEYAPVPVHVGVIEHVEALSPNPAAHE